MSNEYCAIVVTYNRKNMLKLCLEALINQTFKNFDILLIDNASTDGTYEDLKSFIKENNIIYLNTGKNLGGSGGFYYGMRYAYEHNYKWFWIMDDDVVPTDTALSELISHIPYAQKASFLASCVYSKDNKAMNTPEISSFKTNGYKFWYEKLSHSMVRLAHATFVSLLINSEAVRKCGLPLKDYFIWGDDTEYTMRIIGKFGAAYLVGTSKVYHLRENVSNLSMKTENNPNRIKMYYYLIRNTLINTKYYSGKKAFKNQIKARYREILSTIKNPQPYRKMKVLTILKAIRDIKRGNYNSTAIKNRYRVYGQENCIFTVIGNNDVSEELKQKNNIPVINNFPYFSLATLFNDVNSYVLENTSLDVTSDLYSEISGKLKNVLNGKSEYNEYCIIDLSRADLPILTYENNNEVFEISDLSTDYQWNTIKNELDEKCNLVQQEHISDKCIENLYIFVSSLRNYCSPKQIILLTGEDTSGRVKEINNLFIKAFNNKIRVINKENFNTESLVSKII